MVKLLRIFATAVCILVIALNAYSHVFSKNASSISVLQEINILQSGTFAEQINIISDANLIDLVQKLRLKEDVDNNRYLIKLGTQALPKSMGVYDAREGASSSGATWKLRFSKILFLMVAFSFVALFIAGFTNRIVIFYDWRDYFDTLMIFASIVIGALLINFFDGDGPMQFIVLSATTIGSIYYCIKTLRSSIVHNSSIILGSVVGVFKILISAILAILIICKFLDLIAKNGTAATRFASTLFLGLFMYILYMFINGERVDERRCEIAESQEIGEKNERCANKKMQAKVDADILGAKNEEDAGTSHFEASAVNKKAEEAVHVLGHKIGKEIIGEVLKKNLKK